MKILLAAEDAPGLQILRALQERNHDIVAVMATPADRAARGTSVWRAAELVGLPTWPAEQVKDAALGDVVRRLGVDLILNAYSLHVVHDRVLKAARVGAYNLHPGPLPAYAGLNSVCWAIYRGERSHGVTVHRMDPVVDTGPIAYQETFPIEEQDTGLTVSTKCIRVGVELMLQLVDTAALDPDRLPVIEQDLGARTYFGAKVPNGGRLSWSQPAKSARDFVRACDFYPLSSPWGHPTAVIAGRELVIGRVTLSGEPADRPAGHSRADHMGSVFVACTDEWVRVDTVVERGRHLAAAEVLDAGRAVGGRR